MKKLKTEAGYTLIESIGFIGILIMLTLSIISLVSSTLDKFRVSRITQQLIELQRSIDFRFSAAENYKDLTDQKMIQEKIVPADMVSENKLHHAYHGDVTLGKKQKSLFYTITFSQVPYQACVELAMVDWIRRGYSSNLINLKFQIKDKEYIFTWPINSDEPSVEDIQTESVKASENEGQKKDKDSSEDIISNLLRLPMNILSAQLACDPRVAEQDRTIIWTFQ